jgi:hypothetical protein
VEKSINNSYQQSEDNISPTFNVDRNNKYQKQANNPPSLPRKIQSNNPSQSIDNISPFVNRSTDD